MSAGGVDVRRVATPDDLEAAFAVRREVFVVEQDVPPEIELDALDHAPSTVHVLAELDGAVVGTGRLLVDEAHPGVVHVGRVAVRRSARGAGVGEALMRALEAVAVAEHGVPGDDGVRRIRVELSAQEHAIPFYERLGYTVSGEPYLDAGIRHRDAAKVVED